MTKDRGKHTAVKLLIVINQFYKGGAETNLLNLLKALPETDDQVDLLVYDQMKLPNVISLLPQVPPHVTVCDAAGREDGNGFWHKALCRITRDAMKKQLYRPACFEFVKNKHYDAGNFLRRMDFAGICGRTCAGGSKNRLDSFGHRQGALL